MKRTLGLMLFSTILLQGATGCWHSEDRSIYTSTYMNPQSVYAVYKPSNETVWTYDIPPQHKLLVEFDSPGEGGMFYATRNLPTRLEWALYPIDASHSFFMPERLVSSAIESGTVELNGTPIILGATVRPTIDPATVPTDRTVEEIEGDLPEPDADKPAE